MDSSVYMFRACVVILVTVSASYSWNVDYYYDDTPYFFESVDHPDESQLQFPMYQRSQCNCIKLKECKTIALTIFAAPKPLSSDLMKDIRKKACGFVGNDPLVCCPPAEILPRSFREVTSEKPWIWDVISSQPKPTKSKPSNQPNLFNRLNSNWNNNWNNFNVPRPNDVHSPQKPYPNKNTYTRKTKKHYFFDFEDPRTFRNCPPSFSPDFNIPKKFQHVKPIKNFHDISNNGFGSGTPNHNGFDSNHVDNEHDFVFPNMPNLPVDIPKFPSRVSKFPLEKLNLVNRESCGLSINARIIGGDNAVPGQFPWMARLAYRNRSSQLVSYRCSGSVISNKYVLTAAHCVTNLIDDLELVFVRLGELDSKTNLCDNNRNLCSEPQDYEIETIMHHPSYDMPKYANDVALIRLRQTTNSSSISPLCLPLGSYKATDKNLKQKTGIVAGWGVSTLGGTVANPMLQYLQLPIVDTQTCADSYARFSANSRTPIIINDSQLCAQGTANHDTCQGDSGGPIMREDKPTGRYVLLGLVSFGPRTCGVSSFPGVYSRTSSYLEWILNNMQM